MSILWRLFDKLLDIMAGVVLVIIISAVCYT